MHRCNGQRVAMSGTGGQGACAPTHPGSYDKAQYPCLGDGYCRALWSRGDAYEGRPFELQLAHLGAAGVAARFAEDVQYGSCYDSKLPKDW